MTAIQPIRGGYFLGRPPDMHVELKAVLLDFVEPSGLEGVWADDDGSTDLARLVEERELGEGEQRLAQPLLKKPADALLAFVRSRAPQLELDRARSFFHLGAASNKYSTRAFKLF